MSDEEEWRDIQGYEGLYKVSNFGRVKSLKRKALNGVALRPIKERFLSGGRLNGYLLANLSKNGKTKSFRIHRLVAEAFILNPKNKLQVNHINGIKSDNRASNLEWATSHENQSHAWKTGLNTHKGESCRFATLRETEVLEIKYLITMGFYQKEIAIAYGVTSSAISCIRHGKSWGWLNE